MHQSVTTIKGENVLLRPLQESDLEESLRVWTPELRHMYGGSLTAPAGPIEARRAGKRAWLERVERGEEGCCFAIEANGRYIGFVSLKAAGQEKGNASYRIGIENPKCWGCGYGNEVARLVLRYAFETLGLHRVSLRVAAYNIRAIRSYEKSGFRHEGVERDSFFIDGKWHDDVLMAILREEWEESNRAPADDTGLRIRAFTLADYEEVAALWEAAGLGPRPSDTRDEVAKKLRRDPDLFLVACLGGRILGTVIGGWDGRRAWVYRMAVHPDFQRRGIGRQLMREHEERLRRKGALAVNLIYDTKNAQARAFYCSLGYRDRDEVSVLGKALGPKEECNDGSPDD